jgi:hypothetical protein
MRHIGRRPRWEAWRSLKIMDPKTIVVVVVLIAVLAALAYVYVRKRRSAELRQHFGPEYDRAVREHGSERRAEAVLGEREKRVEKFRIRELGAEEREGFISQWRAVQARFVDDPKGAVSQADDLVIQVMQGRGYPMADFEQRAADISVDHPDVVDNYRAAHLIALRHRKGDATTEDLRNAMIYYRSLFEDLLEGRQPSREVA